MIVEKTNRTFCFSTSIVPLTLLMSKNKAKEGKKKTCKQSMCLDKSKDLVTLNNLSSFGLLIAK